MKRCIGLLIVATLLSSCTQNSGNESKYDFMSALDKKIVVDEYKSSLQQIKSEFDSVKTIIKDGTYEEIIESINLEEKESVYDTIKQDIKSHKDMPFDIIEDNVYKIVSLPIYVGRYIYKLKEDNTVWGVECWYDRNKNLTLVRKVYMGVRRWE